MADLRSRFSQADRLPAPDLWPDIELRKPRPTHQSPVRRLLVATVALAIAASGVAFAAVMLKNETERQPPAHPAPTFSASAPVGTIAYVVGIGPDAQIRVVNLDGTGDRLLVHGYDPAWSADGTRIAFASERGGNPQQVYVANVDGTGITQLTEGFSAADWPTWSPDGTRIAFHGSSRESGDDIWLINLDGTGLTQLTDEADNGVDGAHMPAWSPDGTRIAYYANRYDAATRTETQAIYVMNADGSGQTMLTDGSAIDEQPAWSPDGTRIAFSRKRGSSADVYVMNAEGGGLVNLTDHPASDGAPAWSPDGETITFISDRGGVSDVYSMRPDGSEVTELEGFSPGAWDLAWQPAPPRQAATTIHEANGAIYYRVAADDGVSRIDAIEPDGTGERIAFPVDSPVSRGRIAWSSNGRRIAFDAYFGDHVGIFTSDADGSATRRITDGVNDSWPSWSPDGTRIVFVSTRHNPGTEACPTGIDLRCPTDVYVMNADGSGITRLTTDPAPEYDPAWSPDGTRIAFVKEANPRLGSETEVFVMNADGTGLRQLTSTEGGSGFTPGWSPDGSGLVFGSIQYEDWGIFVVNADGTDEHPLLFGDSVSATDPVWSPDGSLIAFAGSVGGDLESLYVVRPDGSGVTRIAGGAQSGFRGDIAWQPLPMLESPSAAHSSSPVPVGT